MIDVAMLEAELQRDPQRRRCGRVAAADGGALLIAGLGDEARLGDRILLAPRPDAEGIGGEIVALAESGGESAGEPTARAMALGHGERGVALAAPPTAPPGAVAAATFDTFRDEVDWLVETVIGRRAAGVPWADQAVLVRRNALLAPIFEAL
ncbi:MAG: hypothetical protein ACK5MQ_12400, partial [Pikeienuella sp.]